MTFRDQSVWARLIALLCALAMLTSFAAAETTYGMAEYQLGGYNYVQEQYGLRAKPSEAFMRSIQPIDITAEDDDIRVTVTEAMCDGEILAVSWLTENLKPEAPAIVQVAYVEVNGELVRVWNTDLCETGGWVPWMFGLGNYKDRFEPKKGGMVTYLRKEKLSGDLEVSVELMISRPTGPLVIVDPFLYADENSSYKDSEDYARMLQDVRESGILVAGEDELDEQAWWDKGYTVIESAGTFPWNESIWRNWTFTDTCSEFEGQMERTGTIQLNFTVSADMGPGVARELTPTCSYTLGDLTLRFERLFMSPLTTIITAELVSDEGEEALDKLRSKPVPQFMFFDAEGNRLDTVNRDWMSSGINPEEKDGHWVSRFDDILPGTVAPAAQMAIGFLGSYNLTARYDDARTLEDLAHLTDKLVIIPLDIE